MAHVIRILAESSLDRQVTVADLIHTTIPNRLIMRDPPLLFQIIPLRTSARLFHQRHLLHLTQIRTPSLTIHTLDVATLGSIGTTTFTGSPIAHEPFRAAGSLTRTLIFRFLVRRAGDVVGNPGVSSQFDYADDVASLDGSSGTGVGAFAPWSCKPFAPALAIAGTGSRGLRFCCFVART